MFKKIFLVSCLLILGNCSAPGTALLGPAFTGAKTGSVYQASLSYGSNRIIEELKLRETIQKIKKLETKIIKETSTLTGIDDILSQQNILLTYKIDKIEITDVVEPEPLP